MLGAVDHLHLHAILGALAEGDGAAMMNVADEMAARSLSFEAALIDMGTLLHRVALAQRVPATVPDDDPDRDAVMALTQRFGADELQLYYQIAVQGRADIGLAPDEYAGFTMTLLRMLAFAPITPVAARVESASAPVRAVVPATAAPIKRAATTPAVNATPPAKPVALAQGASWATLMGELGLVGMTRQLAQNCEMTQLTSDGIDLAIPKAQEHLLAGAHQEKLKIALQQRYGAAFKVAFKVAQGEINSPAAVAKGEQQARQAQAVHEIETDPFVRELVQDFGAKVNASSIKPNT